MNNLQLSIPEPCHENWDKMSPSDRGRFCNACAKQVIDFTNMTDQQLLNYFSTIKDQKVCGRIHTDQLNREISGPAVVKRKRFWFWNYFAAFILFFAKTNSSKAQTTSKVDTVQVPLFSKTLREVVVYSSSNAIQGAMKTYCTSGVSNTSNNEGVKMGALISGMTIRLRKDSLFKKASGLFGIKRENKITLYPNPVKRGNECRISFDLITQNRIYLQVMDIGGRILLERRVDNTGKTFVETIDTDPRWPSGLYIINIFSEGKLLRKINFVVEQ